MDEQTGLVGWSLTENYSIQKPSGEVNTKDYNKSFKIFRERVLEMSKSIKEAISVDTFIDVEHLGGAAAVVIADDNWFKGEDMQIRHFKSMSFGKTKIKHHHFYHLKIPLRKKNLLYYLDLIDQDISNHQNSD